MVPGFENSSFDGGVGEKTGLRSETWNPILGKLSELAPALLLQAARWCVHRPYDKVISQVTVDIDRSAYIGQLPGVNLGHLKNRNPSADYQEGEYDCDDNPS